MYKYFWFRDSLYREMEHWEKEFHDRHRRERALGAC